MKVEDCQTAANLARWHRECKEHILLLDGIASSCEEVRLNFPTLGEIRTDDAESIRRIRMIARSILSGELVVLEKKLREIGVEIPNDDPSAKAA